MRRDRQELQSWYREAMLRRIDELVDLRPSVESGLASALDELRKVGQALRGSGATFGFPRLSAAAEVVETTSDADALRRLEGLLVELHALTGELPGEAGRRYEWLALCAGVSESRLVEALDGVVAIEGAWAAVGHAGGLDEAGLAGAAADRFGLAVADLTDRSPAAWRLVPEAFMAAERVVPVVEDSQTITVATADPVSLGTERELGRLTGRVPVFAVAGPSAIEAVLEANADMGRVARGAATADVPVEERSPEAAPEPSVEEDGTPSEPVATPAKDPPRGEAPSDAPREASSDDDPVRVLIVDDDPSARLLARGILEKRGYSAVEASDGLEAIEVMRSHDRVGLAVVDLNMPRMDGLELIWELRDARRWATLPVIVVTGERDEVLETRIMEEGADDYIRKPVDPRLFLARVEATLRRAGHFAAD